MTKLRRYTYHVFFDSSSIYGEPIAKQLVELIEKYKDDDRVAIKVYLPEIVEKELERRVLADIFQKHKQAQKALKTLKLFFPDINAEIPDDISEEKIIISKERILSELGIEIIPTPVDQINWQDIIRRATRYEPPFEEAHEKGFKDCVIVETAVHHFLSSKKGVYAFVTNDEKMNQYLQEKTVGYTRFSIFDSVPLLETDLKLRIDESTTKIAANLQSEAAKAFFGDNKKTALFNSTALRGRINYQVGELLKSDDIKNRYSTLKIKRHGPIENIQIAKPVFVERPTKTKFVWETTVLSETQLVAERVYENTVINALLRVETKIRWSSSFTKNGEVRHKDSKIISIEVGSYDLEYASSVSTDSFSAFRKLTTTGQPTTPVVQQLKSISELRDAILKAQEQVNIPSKMIKETNSNILQGLQQLLNPYGNSRKPEEDRDQNLNQE